MSGEDIALAARRLVEFESLQSKLHEARRDAITDFDTCIRSYRQTYAGQHELRRELNECEWATYRYASLLHMLGELVQRTSDEFDIRIRDCDPVRHEVPKLIGVRHCIHHRGLIGVNVVSPRNKANPAVGMPLSSLRRHGKWGGNNPKFQTFFYDVSGDALVLRPIVESSGQKCNAIIEEMIGLLETTYGKNQLLKTVTSARPYS
ncbi:hypothetical protein [Halorussus litoreus]|uniref:hypothetical protein n=1 Tax=Halorussus litoreus TaxID=1710536 RepID=UPI000E282BA8|nr:hypothetical protein [Halorussus litoreus]